MTVTIGVILNLIQNQLDPDFRQDDGYEGDSVRQLADRIMREMLEMHETFET